MIRPESRVAEGVSKVSMRVIQPKSLLVNALWGAIAGLYITEELGIWSFVH